MGLVYLAVIFVAIIVVFGAIDRTLFHPLAQANRTADKPEYIRNRGMSHGMALLAIIGVVALLVIAASR